MNKSTIREQQMNLKMSELASSSSPKNSGLSAKLTKLKLSSYTLLLLLLSAASCVVLPSCSSSTATAADDNSNLSTSLTLEKAATVPVLDGKATQTGIYVRNNTGQTISGIQYASVLTNAGAGQHASSLQLSASNCTSIAANSSCLLSFSTPSLSLGQSGSTLIDASYNGQHSKQLINYRYYTSNDYSGVNFSDGSSSLYGTNDYATVYAFVGKSQSQTKVGFNASNSSLAVSSGLTNGSVDIASNQVIALEIKSNQDVTSNLVSLTPYTVTTFKQLANSLQIANLQNQNLQVTISPTQQANLLMSDSPILNATGESSAIITLINNGNQTATNINLTSADSAKVSITAASSNPCTSGGSLEAGASCNYKLSLVDLYNNGQSNLNLAYNNSITNTQATQSVYYYNNLAAPMISVVPASSSFTEGINTANSLVFNVQNIGNAPLNNLNVSLNKTLTQATLSQINNCGAQIKAKASCTITATVSANANVDSGIFYAKLNGNFTNGATTTTYSFISKPVSTTITDSTIATVSSTTPQTAATAVSVATNIALSFSKAMDPTTLNATNIQLQKVSDSSSVPLTFQGVTNNNQTVTFTQTSGKLSDLTNYKIVINPSALIDYNGNSMGASSTQQTASFTTGNSVVNPTISSVNPSTGATNQSTTPTINISFSVPMDTSSLNPSNITLKTGAGVTVAGTSITISNSDQTATVNLSTALADTTTYQLVLNEVNLKSASGGALGSNTAYVATSFTTGDFTAPTLSSTIPLNGATGVAVESPISLTFSEAMNTSTLTTTTVKLQKVSDSSDVSLNSPSFSNGNKTATFQPTANLAAGESYNLVINPSAIKDVAENAMGAASESIVSIFMTLLPQLYITPIKTVHPTDVFNLEITASKNSIFTVDLPAGFSSVDGSTFTCHANPTCSKEITVAPTVIAGYYTISTSLGTSIVIPVAVVKNFAYIPSSVTSGLQVEICEFNDSGFSNCANANPTIGSQKAYGVTISAIGTYAYVATGAGVYKCAVNKTSKTLDSCSYQTSLGALNTRLGAISTNGQYFYINSLGDSTIRQCALSPVDGNLTDCVIAYSGLTASVERLVLDYNGNNLFVNTGSGTKSCSINSNNGGISSCINSGFSSAATGINYNLENTRMYFTQVSNLSAIKFCSYNSITQLLSGCTNAFSGSLGLSGWITGISFSSNFAFVSTVSDVYSCPINNTTGMLSTCSAASSSSSKSAEGIMVFN